MHKKRVFVGFSALSALLLSGCGGSSGSVHVPTQTSGTLNFRSGATTTDTISSTVIVPASGGIQETTAGGQTVIVPSGATFNGSSTIPAGTNYAIIPAGTGFVNTPGSIPVGTEISINGVANSGATVNGVGQTTMAIALPVATGSAGTSYTLSFPDATLDTSRVLTIQNISFTGAFYISLSPFQIISPIPTSITGTIPNNGQNAGGLP